MAKLNITATPEAFEKFQERAKEIGQLRGVELAQKLADLSGEHADVMLLCSIAQRRVVKLAEEGDREALETIRENGERVQKELEKDFKLLTQKTDGKVH